jgi:AraC-like DNA-binding protein
VVVVAQHDTVMESPLHRPPAVLRPYVDHYVGYRMAGFAAGEHMGLPSRYLTFIVSFDAPLHLRVQPDGSEEPSWCDTMLGGLHTRPAVICHDGNQHGIQLHVTPAGARRLFGLPAGPLSGLVVPLGELWGPIAAELHERLEGTAGWGQRFAILDEVLIRRMTVHPDRTASPELRRAWQRLLSGEGQVAIGALAKEVGWSRRHLNQRFTAEFGIGPKAMARVVRFERAKSMIVQPGRPGLATIAAMCGYADQAHLTREWRGFAGASPTEWLAAEELPFVQACQADDGAP